MLMPTVEVQKTHIFYTSSGTGVPCLVMHGGLGLDHTYLRGLDMLEVFVTIPAEDESLKNMFKLVLPLYFTRYQSAYVALFAETIMCAACAEHQEQMLAAYNMLPHLHKISCPTLVLVGRHDIIC